MPTILEMMLENCKKAGYYPTQNIEKIARAKNMMFVRANGAVVRVTVKMKKDIVFPSFVAAISNATEFVIVVAIKKQVRTANNFR